MSLYHIGHAEGVADRHAGKLPANTELMLNTGRRHGYQAGWADEDNRLSREAAKAAK